MRADFLIVGQGLAGSLLAWRLIQQNRKVIVIDNGLENASQVAAGIINPLTGQRLVKSAAIETLLPAAIACYAALSRAFRQPFYIQKPMLRLFRSEVEAKAGLKRLGDTDYHAYIDNAIPPNPALSEVAMPFGGLLQKQTGHLLTVPLLSCLQDFLIAKRSYRRQDFDYSDLKIKPTLRWQDITPQRVIFCEGYRLIGNPWFSWLPLQPVKGEILTLHSDNPVPDKLLNDGHWLLPLDNQHFRLGATFDRKTLNTEPTPQGSDELLHHLSALSTTLSAATIIRHQAHIRPCTLDRQPLLGNHPQIPALSVFNGFGAKGSLSIPWFSQHFTDALLKGTPLAKTCDIQRYPARHIHAGGSLSGA